MKEILWIFQDEDLFSYIEHDLYSSSYREKVDVICIPSDFCYTYLPKSLMNSEIDRCVASVDYLKREEVERGLRFLKDNDIASYKEIVVWTDYTASDILLSYFVCSILQMIYYQNLFFNDFSLRKYFVNRSSEENYDLSIMLRDKEHLSLEDLNYWSCQWYELAKLDRSPRIIQDGVIKPVSDLLLRKRILDNCMDFFIQAYFVSFNAQQENLYESFFPQYAYTEVALQMVREGLIDIQETEESEIHDEYRDYPPINGIAVRNVWTYDLKLKK